MSNLTEEHIKTLLAGIQDRYSGQDLISLGCVVIHLLS